MVLIWGLSIMRGMGRGAKRVRKQYIGYWLKKRGIKQRDLADKLGVSEPYISDVSRGKKTPSVAVCLQIAKILGVHVEQLFTAPPKT